MTALLLAIAALGLCGGAALMAWPVRLAGSTSAQAQEALGRSAAPVPAPVAPAPDPAVYRRRILGAMIVGASLFLGGFTLAWELAA